LQSITDAALAHLELDDLLTELLRRTRSLLEVDTCAVFLVDARSGELVARAAVGIEHETEAPLGHGLASRIAAERRPVALPDVEHEDVRDPLLRAQGVRSLLGVPLLSGASLSGASPIGASPIGVLQVGSLVRREFGQDETDLLQLVADRLALAIEHAHVLQAEREARERLERIQAVTDAALAHLQLDELLPELLARIKLALEVDTIAILLLDEERNELVARAAVGIEEEVEQEVRIPVGAGFAGRIAARRRPVFLPDVDHADVLNPILREKGIKSLLGVPLVTHDTVIGVLHVGSLVPREFTSDDTELLQLVAERAALAIERARVHDEIVRLDQLKANFVAIASHELRSPAAGVYGALMTLRARGETLPPEVRAELEETAFQQADRMRLLIEQLLDMSRLDSFAMRIDPQPLVLREVISDIAHGDDVIVDVDPGIAVVADPLVLDRVITNLVLNARSYGRPPIRVAVEERDRHLRIVVSDEGEGIPEELVPRLFERFERGAEGHGSGLGLAIARAYAVAHGGELLYLPSDCGARFEFVLPRS
jgi:signal transduction histidine kinase